jgi:hypothetical protein
MRPALGDCAARARSYVEAGAFVQLARAPAVDDVGERGLIKR